MEYAAFIRIAADSIERLRSVDVFRVLDCCPPRHRPGLAVWMTSQRVELASEITSCLEEIANEERRLRIEKGA